jgi:decaprenylphospho-beta-D-erythro-pentofuranosid-2-ulose 2-reductase
MRKGFMANQQIVIVGATSAIAEQCARLWLAQSPADLTLVARNTNKAEMIASDLRARSPGSNVQVMQTDFLDPDSIAKLVDRVTQHKVLDIVLIAHGSLPDQQDCQQDLGLNQSALQLNAISPVLFAEVFVGKMEIVNHGKLVVIGSVAGDRGRKSNYVYGAAKGLVTRYVQGLQHRLANTKVKVVLIKPGPTDTPMTAHLKQSGTKLAALDRVAEEIVRGTESGCRIVYTPKIWSAIMMIIRHLPHFVFRRMDV